MPENTVIEIAQNEYCVDITQSEVISITAENSLTQVEVSSTVIDVNIPQNSTTVIEVGIPGPPGPQGPPGTGGVYIFDQSTPSTTWTINHNLNTYPSVTIVDSGKTVVFGEISYNNTNSITLTFTSAFGGFAYLGY